MGLFYKNEVAGRGVAKNTWRQNTFSRYWKLLFRKVGAVFKINIVYFLFCLPVVTFGPATTAMTGMMRNIYLERPQFIFHDFWKLFKENFRKSVFIGILNVIAFVSVWFILTVLAQDPDMESSMRIMLYVCIGAEALFALASFYIYQQTAAVDLPLTAIIKNALILMCANLKGLIVLALLAGYVLLAWNFPVPVLITAPFFPLAWLSYTAVFCCYPTIQKHLIEPYYEQKGEKNPEITETDEDKALFEDGNGNDEPLDVDKKKGKRVIK